MAIKSLTRELMSSLFVAVFIFLLSMLIMPYSVEGDQSLYRMVYADLADRDIVSGYIWYAMNLDAQEFVHFFLSWIAAHLQVDKDFFISLSNALLAFLTMKLFRKWNVSFIIGAFVILTNFYLIELYTTIERLKFGMIFFILSLLYTKKEKHFYFYALMASITHIQIMLLYTAMLFNHTIYGIKRILLVGKISKKIFPISIIIIVTLLIISDQIYSKFGSYFREHDLLGFIKSLVFFALSLWYSRNRVETIAIYIPILFAVFFLGGERINIFSYFIFLYYALPVNRGFNIGIFLTSLYYFINSIDFIEKIIFYGYGF